MLTARMRRQLSENIDILDVERKQSTPGSAIPTSAVQSGLRCVFLERTENVRATVRNSVELAPATSQSIIYTCYLFDGVKPTVGQLLRRDTGEKLSVMTDPKKVRGVIYFECLHVS